MKKNSIILAALLLTAPVLGLSMTTAADNDDNGTTQTLTIAGETVERTLSEIRINANNVILLFTDDSQLEVDMKTVSLSMSYDDATGISSLRVDNGDGKTTVYNLQGQPVSKSSQQNGVYIVNGKKVNIKK
jgi:hypothetical protein